MIIFNINKDELYLNAISVKQDFRGKGISTILLNNTVAHCKEKGLNKISLFVEIENKKAFSIYKKFGFNVENTVNNLPFIKKADISGFYKMIKIIP